MLRTHLFALVVVVLAVVLVVGGCPKKQPMQEPVMPVGGPAAPVTDAATPGAQPPDAQPAAAGEVTKDQVKNFMAAMEDKQVEAAMDKLGEEAGIEKGKDKDVDAATMAKIFEAAVKSDDLAKAVQAHGFKDAAEWVATAKVVFPGMGHAMAMAMAPTLGVKEGTPEFEKMMKESEFAEMEKAFGKLSPEQQKLVDEAVADMMKEQMSKHDKK